MNAQERYAIGKPIFDALFNMNTAEIKEKLISILPDQKTLIDGSAILKTSLNDDPDEIVVYHYDKLRISVFGIEFIKEHGESKVLINFDNHFKL